jgi:hypothetical protein
MGYASTIPFTISKSVSTATSQQFFGITNIVGDYWVTTVTTLDYKLPFAYVFAEVIIPVREEYSGFDNWIDTANGYLELDDGVHAVINAGAIREGSMYMKASNFCGSEIRIPCSTNISAYILANTTYTCYFRNIKCVTDGIAVYNPRVELNIYSEL